MWYKLWLISLLALLYTGCDTYDDCCHPLKEIRGEDNVFSRPRVGKTSYYISFQSKLLFNDQRWYFSEEEYVNDTLEIKVVDLNRGVYTLSEQYTPGSKSYPEIQADTSRGAIQYFTLEPTADGWIVGPVAGKPELQSFLFGYQTGFELPTDGDQINLLPERVTLTTMGRRYEDLNLSYNYAPMTYDGAGLHWYHSKDAGIVRVGFMGAMIPQGNGWDFLDKDDL